jgi:hypothetical protein
MLEKDIFDGIKLVFLLLALVVIIAYCLYQAIRGLYQATINGPGTRGNLMAREWKRCIHGHWGTRGEYCLTCGTYLLPQSLATNQRLSYIVDHDLVKLYMGDSATRAHFACWLVSLEKEDFCEYPLSIGIELYRCSWKLRTEQIMEEN